MATVFAPGRVNLIGEHTDYTGGLVLPMALELGITFSGRADPERLHVVSDGHDDLDVALPLPDRTSAIAAIEPSWGRYLVAVARRLGVSPGIDGKISSTLPAGGTGLSSSTALTCAALLLLGGTGPPLELAKLARQAEIDATGVQIGLMDQAACLASRRDHALLMDCEAVTVSHVAVPESIEVLVVHSGQSRRLADSAYNDRQAACAAVEERIGPLRRATMADVDRLDDPILRKRARHVVTENDRVMAMVEALGADDPETAGAILTAGHASLADDYEVSTPIVDRMVAALAATDGVYGARMTGGGFGGSLVALCRPGTEPPVDTWWTRARPGAGARIIEA